MPCFPYKIIWLEQTQLGQTTRVRQSEYVTRKLFSSVSASRQEFPAPVNVVQVTVSCVSKDQSTLEELEKMLFSSRHRLLHCLINLSKSNGRLNRSCGIFSVPLSRSCSTFSLRTYLFIFGFSKNACIYVMTECSKFVELQCLEQLKKKKFYNGFCGCEVRLSRFSLSMLMHVHVHLRLQRAMVAMNDFSVIVTWGFVVTKFGCIRLYILNNVMLLQKCGQIDCVSLRRGNFFKQGHSILNIGEQSCISVILENSEEKNAVKTFKGELSPKNKCG